MKRAHMVLLFAFISAAPATAQDASEQDLIASLARCLDVREDTSRLACTDVAARRLVDAARRKEVVLVDRQEVTKTRRSLFGFSLPRIGLFGRDGPDKAEDEIDQVEAAITKVVELGYGKYAITVDSGARWNTTEAWEGPTRPAAGLTATIKRGTLGGYFLKIGKTRAVRAIRVG